MVERVGIAAGQPSAGLQRRRAELDEACLVHATALPEGSDVRGEDPVAAPSEDPRPVGAPPLAYRLGPVEAPYLQGLVNRQPDSVVRPPRRPSDPIISELAPRASCDVPDLGTLTECQDKASVRRADDLVRSGEGRGRRDDGARCTVAPEEASLAQGEEQVPAPAGALGLRPQLGDDGAPLEIPQGSPSGQTAVRTPGHDRNDRGSRRGAALPPRERCDGPFTITAPGARVRSAEPHGEQRDQQGAPHPDR
jgi:hypothetical protein